MKPIVQDLRNVLTMLRTHFLWSEHGLFMSDYQRMRNRFEPTIFKYEDIEERLKWPYGQI